MMKTKWIFKAFAMLFCIAIISSCEYEFVEPEAQAPPPDPEEKVSFSEQIVPIFNEQSCNVSSCHGGQ